MNSSKFIARLQQLDLLRAFPLFLGRPAPPLPADPPVLAPADILALAPVRGPHRPGRPAPDGVRDRGHRDRRPRPVTGFRFWPVDPGIRLRYSWPISRVSAGSTNRGGVLLHPGSNRHPARLRLERRVLDARV